MNKTNATGDMFSNSDPFKGEMDQTIYTVIGVFLVVSGLAAYIGNGTFLVVILKDARFRQPVNALILNLVISDLAVALMCYPLSAISNLNGRWSFGFEACKLYGFLTYCCGLVSMWTYCAIGIYRYLAICRPEFVPPLKRKKTIYAVIIGIWAYSFFWALLPLLGWGKYNMEPFRTSCSLDWQNMSYNNRTYIYGVLIFCMVIPVAVIVFSYIKVCKALRMQIQPVVALVTSTSNTDPRNGISSISNLMRNRSNKMIAISLLMWLIAWIPYSLTSTLTSVFQMRIPLFLSAVPALIAKSHCACNPFVYLILHDQFKNHVLGLLGKKTSNRTNFILA